METRERSLNTRLIEATANRTEYGLEVPMWDGQKQQAL